MLVVAGHSCPLGNTLYPLPIDPLAYIMQDIVVGWKHVRIFFLLQSHFFSHLWTTPCLTIFHSKPGGRFPLYFAADNWQLGIVLSAWKVGGKKKFSLLLGKLVQKGPLSRAFGRRYRIETQPDRKVPRVSRRIVISVTQSCQSFCSQV